MNKSLENNIHKLVQDVLNDFNNIDDEDEIGFHDYYIERDDVEGIVITLEFLDVMSKIRAEIYSDRVEKLKQSHISDNDYNEILNYVKIELS